MVSPRDADENISTPVYNAAARGSVDDFDLSSPLSVAEDTVITPDRNRSLAQSHKRMVFSDPVAFRYLEEDDSTIVLDRWVKLGGYELYIVEQWVCSRTHPTFIICTHTGDPSNTILVNVLAIPVDETRWSRRLQIYFQAVSQFHAREQETNLGTLMVTNLSGFPSALSVIAVPDGDIKRHREDFIVNENLKRMGCSGRAAMTLQEPAASTMAKFHHLYQTSEAISFSASVIELVKACQQALILFGKLDSIYADGLLCDITESAVSNWWNDIGTEFHNVEPSDGVLGPTTVSALLGLLIGAHSRLKAASVAGSKDPLDVDQMKRSIESFQKAHKMERSRRLDWETLDRLHRSTAKNASGEGWAVPRAVKSTVAELGGKGGEMVMGIVGGRGEKSGIAEAETLDIDRLAQLVQGPRLKWLWRGKPLKAGLGEFIHQQPDEAMGKIFDPDSEGKFRRTVGGREVVFDNTSEGPPVPSDPGDGRSGVRRLKDAVGISGLKSHRSRHHKHDDEDSGDLDEWGSDEAKVSQRLKKQKRPPESTLRAPTNTRRSPERSQTDVPPYNLALAVVDSPQRQSDKPAARLHPVPHTSLDSLPPHREQLKAVDRRHSSSPGKRGAQRRFNSIREAVQSDVYQKFTTEFDDREPENTILRRSKSAMEARDIEAGSAQLLTLPRRLSFGFVEDATLRDATLMDFGGLLDRDPPQVMAMRQAEARHLEELTSDLFRLETLIIPFADAEVTQVERLDANAREHLTELNNYYFANLDEYQTLQATSVDLMGREKTLLKDSLRRVEGLGAKLDYELEALQSKIQEVEEGTVEFERNVLEIEARVARLVDDKSAMAEPPGASKVFSWFQQLLGSVGSSEP